MQQLVLTTADNPGFNKTWVNKSMQFQLLVRNRRKIAFAQKFLCSLSLAFGLGVGMPSTLAAQRVIIRLGPFEQSVAIADLEKYADFLPIAEIA